MQAQALPNNYGDVFGRGVKCTKFFRVEVQIMVVVAVEHLALNEVAQALRIVHIPSLYVYRSGQTYREVVIVAVVVRIVALAKNAVVLLGIPGRIVEAVSSIEVLITADSDLHRGLQPRAWLLCCVAVLMGKSRQNAFVNFVEFNNASI